MIDLFKAGALVPPDSKVNTKDCDVIDARIYSHPALESPIVRLTSSKLASGDDLEMEFLGFEAPEVVKKVALRKRQALGFPGWALVHDPKHASYALKVVKSIKKSARLAKSKPGGAWDQFGEVADQLGRSVANFLPSYWEEVGRIYLSYSNTTYATRSFTKAREAEKVHALKVDENMRRESFVEFALAGAVSIKALTEYSKSLMASKNPKEGWKFFRELCAKRTMGGMPPWAGMLKDMKPLIKAAGLNQDDEIEAFLREILEAASINRAPEGFWKNCTAIIKKRLTPDLAAAKKLLYIIPKVNWGSGVWWWIALLDKWEILQQLWENDELTYADLHKWFKGVFDEVGSSWGSSLDNKIFPIIENCAEKLKKGEPLKLFWKKYYGKNLEMHVDLTDYALELGIPIADPPKKTAMSFGEWAEGHGKEYNRPRDPKFLAADGRFDEMIQVGLAEQFGESSFEAAAFGKESLKEPRRQWIMSLAESIGEEGAIPFAEETVDRLNSQTSKKTYIEFPEAYEILKTKTFYTNLQNNLRNGIIDEYGWPLLEEVYGELSAGEDKVHVNTRFPYVTIYNASKAVTIDREKRLVEHEIIHQKGYKLECVTYFDKQLQVIFKKSYYDYRWYWSDSPKSLHDHEGWMNFNSDASKSSLQVDLPEGGSFTGEKIGYAGKVQSISESKFYFDGEHFFSKQWVNQDYQFYEINPATGEKGRKSMPSFFEDTLNEGWELESSNSYLYQIDGLKNSPLGVKDGKIGFLMQTKDDSHIGTGIDGRTLTNESFNFNGLLDLPESGLKIPVTGAVGEYSYYAESYGLLDTEGKFKTASFSDSTKYNAGQPVALSPLFWHYYTVRDASTSKALREITEEECKQLLDSALEEYNNSDDKFECKFTAAAELIEKGYNIKSDALKKGILGIVVEAAMQTSRFNSFLEKCDPDKETVKTVDNISVLSKHCKTFLDSLQRYYYGSDEGLENNLPNAARFFSGEIESMDKFHCIWFPLLGDLPYWVWDKAWNNPRNIFPKIKSVLEVWENSGLEDLEGSFVLYTGSLKDGHPYDLSDYRSCISVDNRYLGYIEYSGSEVLEYVPPGEDPRPLPHFEVETTRNLERFNFDLVKELYKCLEEKGLPEWCEKSFGILQEPTGLNYAESALVLCCFPNFNSYEKNFMEKELREKLNLKVAEADAARNSLKEIDQNIRRKIICEWMKNFDLIWNQQEQAVDILSKIWLKELPKRAKLPDGMKEWINKFLFNKSAIVEALQDPDTYTPLHKEPYCSYDNADVSYREIDFKNEQDCFNIDILPDFMKILMYSSHSLRRGEIPIEALDKINGLLKERLKNEHLIVPINRWYSYDVKDNHPVFQQFSDMKKKKGMEIYEEEGLFVLRHENSWSLHAIPSKLTEAVIARLQAMIITLNAFETYSSSNLAEILIDFRSGKLDVLIEGIKNSRAEEDQYTADPLVSAPEAVAEVSMHENISEDSSRLYLQTLALPDPTSKNIQLWNGWKKKEYDTAAKELVAKGLLVEAKRSRAGRTYFLPGGWIEMKNPYLPFERWKLQLFGLSGEFEKPALPYGVILPLTSHANLYKQVWEKIKQGDTPQYDEV